MFQYHAHLGSQQKKKNMFSVIPPVIHIFFYGSMIQITIENLIIYLSVQTTLPSILSPDVKTD